MKVWGLIWVGLLAWGSVLQAENYRTDAGSPSDLWYRGFLLTKKAEELGEKGDRIAAFNKLNEAFDIFKDLSLNHPEFQAPLVKRRLLLIAEQRQGLKRELKEANPPSDKKRSDPDTEIGDLRERARILQKELNELKSQLKRKSVPDEKLELPKKEEEQANADDERTGILEDLVKKLDFQERLTDEEKRLFANPSQFSQLFPEGWRSLKDENGTDIVIEEKPSSTDKIPENWIPRPFEGRMTYIVPLIETPETRAFSKRQTVPAAVFQSKLPGEK